VYAGSELVADLFTTIAAVFLWFAAALTLLKILGMGEIAASLGTATGFVALGVSYALSDMIADTVSGVYLLRDPDFNPGDRVETADVTGVVRQIDLRKTRLEVDEGDTLVVGNSSVEEKWTKKGDATVSEVAVEEETSSDESPSPSE
jgi:small-conductance mechanosensitive channel